VKCNHQRYKNGGYLTAGNALKAMKKGVICWMSETVKACECCGEDLSMHSVVKVKTSDEYIRGLGL